MRKFKEPLPLGGVPFFADDFLMLQGELMKASLYMYSSLSTEVILSGCNLTLTGSGASTQVSALSSGFVMMRDKLNAFKPEIYFVPQTTFGSSVSKIWIAPTTDVAESRTLKSGSTADVVVTKTAQVITDSGSAPDPADPQIIFDPLPSVRIRHLLFRHSKRIGEIIPIGLVPPFKSNPMEGLNGVPLFLQTDVSPTEKRGLGKYSYEGFAICNGNNNTPDMRRRFLAGMDPSHSYFNAIGKIGGAEEVKLYAEYLPSHTHGGTTSVGGQHNHHVTFSLNGAGDGLYAYESSNASLPGGGGIGTYPTSANGSHSHTFTTNGGNGLAGAPHDNRPPFYTALYIQRIF